MKDVLLGFFVVLGILLGATAISWGICNWVVWLISLCFGFEYTFLIGTGVYIIVACTILILKVAMMPIGKDI